MNIPANLKYAKSHEWVLFDGPQNARIGLTEFALSSLGSLVYVNLPAEGDTVVFGESLGDVESVKAVSDVISPLSGTVSAVNVELADAPEKINEDPYGSWLVEISVTGGQVELMDAAAYEKFCDGEG